MAIENTPKELNVRLFFRGPGATDSKMGVNSLIELNELITLYGDYYRNNDIVWVVSEAAWYIISVVGASITYSPHAGSGGNGEITIYYGGQDNINAFLAGDPAYKPSLKGYTDQDAIVASRAVGVVNRFDIYEVSIPDVGNESYIYAGSMIGTTGADGDKGDKGDTGDVGPAMTVDNQGLLSGLNTNCENYPEGYSYLATDTGNLYFKTSALGVLPCTWSLPIPFGKGEAGATTYFVWKRAASQPSTPPIDSVNIPATWSDYPPTTGDPTQRLWMTKATYSLDSGGNPVGSIVWTSPVQMDGEEGADGIEGKDAGFWVMWSDEEAPNRIGLPKPVDHALDLTGEPDWYDDIDNTDSPIWMAQIPYNSLTSLWGDWGFSRIAGEEPPYKLNIFKRDTSAPATPTGGLPYKQGDGSFSDGADAVAANPTWTDAPTATGDPLYFSELILYKGVTNSDWSPPVRIDGDEGTAAGIWTIWSNNSIGSKPAAPAPVENIISGDGSSLDLSGSPAWYDDVTGIEPNWMANSFYKPAVGGGFEWTAWAIVLIKGEDGNSGIAGTDARTYVPSTMFTRGDNINIGDTDITDANNALGALYLLGDNDIGYTITGQSPPNNTVPATITITVDGENYKFTDGIPPVGAEYPENSLKVWQISAVFNSIDHLGYNNKMVWDKPVLVADTGAVDYQYNDGVGAGHTDPGDPGPSGTENGWYDGPKSTSYWAAQKNWSEGVTAQWVWYRIRGEDGSSSKSWYSIHQPGAPTLPAQWPSMDTLGNPETKPELWQDFLTPVTYINFALPGQSTMGHYWTIEGGTGNWGAPVDRATELPDVDMGTVTIANNLTLTDITSPDGVSTNMTAIGPYLRPGDFFKVGAGSAVIDGGSIGPGDYIHFNPLIVNDYAWYPNSVSYYSVLTQGDHVAPSKPGNPYVRQPIIGVNSMSISWAASTDAVGVTSYTVERSVNDGTWSTVKTLYGSGSNPPLNSFNDTNNIGHANKYAYRVTAKDAAHNASTSNVGFAYCTNALLSMNTLYASGQVGESVPCTGDPYQSGTYVQLYSTRPSSTDQVGATLFTQPDGTQPYEASDRWLFQGWKNYQQIRVQSGIVTAEANCSGPTGGLPE